MQAATKVVHANQPDLTFVVIPFTILRVGEIGDGHVRPPAPAHHRRALQHPTLVGEAILPVDESKPRVHAMAPLIENQDPRATLGSQASRSWLRR